MKWMNRIVLGLVVAALTLPAAAQRQNYKVDEMNFDLWCQEQAGLPPERCDKRSAADEAAFEAFRAKVEAYEIPYLQQKNKDLRIDRDILRGDPVDNPIDKDVGQQTGNPNTISTTTPPRP